MEIMSQCDICSGGCPVNSHRVSEWVLSISMNKSEANCCEKRKTVGWFKHDFPQFFGIVWKQIYFTELSANNYDQHPLLVNKCKVNSVSRAHCSSTAQFCTAGKVIGKIKEKKKTAQSVVVYTNYFGVVSEGISGVKTCQCGATHCDDPL